MSNPIKKATFRTVKFVSEHRVAVAIVTTASATAAVMLKVRSIDTERLNEFLDEKGLIEEFYGKTEEFIGDLTN